MFKKLAVVFIYINIYLFYINDTNNTALHWPILPTGHTLFSLKNLFWFRQIVVASWTPMLRSLSYFEGGIVGLNLHAGVNN